MKFHGQTAHREANANLQATQDCQGSGEAALTHLTKAETQPRCGSKAGQAAAIQTFTYPALGKTYAIKEAGTRNLAGHVKVTGKAMKLRKQIWEPQHMLRWKGPSGLQGTGFSFWGYHISFPETSLTPSHSKKTPLVYNKNGTFEQAQDLAKDAAPAEPPPVVFGILARQEKKRKKSLPQLFPLEMGT